MIQWKEDIKNYLLNSLEDAKLASGGKQIVCRCKLGCGDKKRHLYIGPFDNSDGPIVYNCFKCPDTSKTKSGIVNKEFLENYGISSNLGNEIVSNNKGNGFKTYTRNKDHIFNISNYYITDCELSRQKLKYINDRLGLNLTYQDCIDNKIVLNLVDLLKTNNIRKFTRHPDIVKQLNNNFLGFLSRTNGSLNMRNLNEGNVYDSIDKKYVNYKLFESDMKYDFFILPNTININNSVKVYIAEGAFDILSIYYNLVHDKTNSFFISGKGKTYYSAVEFLLLTYGIYDMELHFYPDKDVTDHNINTIVEYLDPYGFEIYIHRNIYGDEKDYGVPLSRIVEQIRRVR